MCNYKLSLSTDYPHQEMTSTAWKMKINTIWVYVINSMFILFGNFLFVFPPTPEALAKSLLSWYVDSSELIYLYMCVCIEPRVTAWRVPEMSHSWMKSPSHRRAATFRYRAGYIHKSESPPLQSDSAMKTSKRKLKEQYNHRVKDVKTAWFTGWAQDQGNKAL